MARVFNFSAGPAALPEAVLAQAQQELLEWQGQGCSVMELSHRSQAYIDVAAQAEADVRELLKVPENYHVLFMHGGGRGQFAAVPMNLAGEHSNADFLVTGSWSEGAYQEAQKYLQANVVGQSQNLDGQVSVPDQTAWTLDPNAAYLHYCPNETVDGVALSEIPDTGDVPLVADMSSTILSAPIDVGRFGLIYAGAQKNLGPSGITLVIVREELCGNARTSTPSIFDYQLQASKDSMYNTPPTFAWYLTGLVLQWLKAQGGPEAMAKVNAEKARRLYQAIDQSDFYLNPVAVANRSIMNVPFQLADPRLDSEFLQQAETAGLKALKGHRLVGGMRASLYNAVPLEAVDALVAFMHDFEQRNA